MLLPLCPYIHALKKIFFQEVLLLPPGERGGEKERDLSPATIATLSHISVPHLWRRWEQLKQESQHLIARTCDGPFRFERPLPHFLPEERLLLQEALWPHDLFALEHVPLPVSICTHARTPLAPPALAEPEGVSQSPRFDFDDDKDKTHAGLPTLSCERLGFHITTARLRTRLHATLFPHVPFLIRLTPLHTSLSAALHLRKEGLRAYALGIPADLHTPLLPIGLDDFPTTFDNHFRELAQNLFFQGAMGP